MKTTTRETIGSVLLAGCVLLLGSIGPDIADAQTSRARLEAEAHYTDGGTEGCMSCHGGETMTVLSETPHGNLDNPHSPYSQQGCESCHGPGSVHASRAAGGAGFPPLLSFVSRDDVPEQNAACLNCHAQTMGELEGIAWAGSLHDAAGMSCQTCHQSHSTENPMADQALQQQNCTLCHRRQIDSHPRFEDKGILFDDLMCSACHDVHELQAEP